MSHPTASDSYPRHIRICTALIPSFGGMALLSLDAGRQLSSAVLYVVASALLVVAAGMLATVLAATARIQPDGKEKNHDLHDTGDAGTRAPGQRKRLKNRASPPKDTLWRLDPFWRFDPSSEALPLILTLVLSAVALVPLMRGWSGAQPYSPSLQAWLAGILIGLTFPLVAAEHYFAAISPKRLPESPALSGLLRLLTVTLLSSGICLALARLGLEPAALLIARALCVLIGLVAIELCIRSVLRWYSAPVEQHNRRSHADSAIARMLRLQWPGAAQLGATVSQQLGIDLARSWALGFLRRALLPALAALAVAGWLLTGISTLGLSERAIYESLGRPVAVLHAGLHVHLPWPLGKLRRLPYGEVRELPIAFAEGSDATLNPDAEVAPTFDPTNFDIEGAPPSSADRLWDAAHPSEASYLVASASNERQNFEVINIDLRVLYRIGLSDQAAQQATYNIATAEDTIRGAAGQMLARYFSRYTVMDVLGQNRESFIRGFQRELQARLTALTSGVEIMGVIVEAIHPPPSAASAYQGVQTAAIRSVLRVAEARAQASQAIGSAQSQAAQLRNGATAAAAERLGAAQAELALFAGDRAAQRIGGAAFMLERRIQRFNEALSRAGVTIVDHRIAPASVPLFDLRPPSSATSFAPVPEYEH